MQGSALSGMLGSLFIILTSGNICGDDVMHCIIHWGGIDTSALYSPQCTYIQYKLVQYIHALLVSGSTMYAALSSPAVAPLCILIPL